MDYISAELSATCDALGYYDGHTYKLDRHCLDVIKDLIKYLKRDDDTHSIRRHLGQTKILQTDLLKIFVEHYEKLELWDVLLRLMINLTSPAFIIYNEEVPTEKSARSLYEQIVSHLQGYKVALTDERIWNAVSSRLEKIFAIESSERGEENEMVIDRILIFIRNVLQIPPDESERTADNEATVHDELLFALHTSNIIDILLFIASNSNEQQYHMQILEIISLMLQEQSANKLAVAGLQRSAAEKEKEEAELLTIRQKEAEEKLQKIKKYAGSRHSRFGGTFVVKNMKAVGESQLICHKLCPDIESLEFGSHKTKLKKPKNKLGLPDGKDERTSALSVRLFLKEFCVEFLNGAYNPVMRHARSCVVNSLADSSSYFWAMRFFMEFNRHYKFQVKYVSETISKEIFHLVQRQMEQCYEMMLTDKKKIPLWSRRLHLALKAYQELLHTLMAMDKSTDQGVRESSKVIKSNVFYVPEYRETILSQLLCFDEIKMSRKYLIDLITTAHIFLKMLETFCSRGQRSIVVQKMNKKRKSKKRKSTAGKNTKPIPTLEERWDDVGPEISAVMQEGAASIPEVIPFDATLDVPIDDQKQDAMKKVQKFLRQKNLEQAIGLFRAARDVWPENDCFGRAGMPAEEEFLALREIFFADLGVVEEDWWIKGTVTNEEEEHTRNQENENDEEEEDEEEEDEEVESEMLAVEETDFKFPEFLHRFANVKIVKALTFALQQFEKNSPEVNHYIAKMLHRIAWDCKMPGMMFQASLFRIFQRILHSKENAHRELQKFAVFVVRRFTEVAQWNRKVYMELLFWKATRDATEVVDGYNAETDNKKVPPRGLWTEEEEDELRTLFMEHQTNKYPEDLVDWILRNLINENRTRRAVIKKLKEMCLVVNSKAVRAEVQKRLPKEWAEEEIAQLAELWEQVREDEDPIGEIYNGLRIKRPKPKIKEKLLELGLAKDRKELRKKRSKKSSQGKSSWETQSANSSSEYEDSEAETAGASGRKNASRQKTGQKRAPRRSTKKRSAIVYTDAQLSGLLKDVIERGMLEAMEWLKESLQDALNDRDEESSEGIPLVPLTDDSAVAMDSPYFQKLLRAIGIEPPAAESEAYWRIPANMSNAMIRRRCNVVADAIHGKFPSEDAPQEHGRDVSEENGDTDSSTDAFEQVKKFLHRREPQASTSGETTTKTNAEEEKFRGREEDRGPNGIDINEKLVEEADEDVSNTGAAKTAEEDAEEDTTRTAGESRKQSGRRATAIFDSSESETDIPAKSDDKNEDRTDNKENTATLNSSPKKHRILESDEESEPKNNVREMKNSQDENKRSRSESPETEKAGNKKRRMLDSDEEGEDSLSTTQHNNSKTSRLIVSDDDDED